MTLWVGLALIVCVSPSLSANPLRFVVIGDTQGAGAGTADIVSQLLNDVAARNPAFVVFPGDLVGRGSVSTFASWKRLTNQFGNHRYMVPGNHDLPGRPATTGDWQSIFSWLPDSQEVPNSTTVNPNDTIKGIDQMDYYVDVAPHIRLISVTTDRDTLPGEVENYPGFEIIGGPPRALDWFQSVMAMESTQEKEFVFVFTHHPITTQSGHWDSSEEEGTASEWWKSIAGTSCLFDGAVATAIFAGHVHAYYPNHPDPHSHTAEVVVGTGGGPNSGVPHRQVHGFLEVVVENGDVTSTFYGDSNGAVDAWSFTEAMDTFTILKNASVPQGELVFYRFEANEPDLDSSHSPLSKHHVLHFNGAGADIVNDPVRGSVLSLDGHSYVDAKSLGDHNLQILRDLRIQLWAKAEGVLGRDPIDNMLVAFGDADGAVKVGGSHQAQQVADEIANYAYQLCYTADARLRLRWEYRDNPTVGAAPKVEMLTSTEAVANPDQWHHIEVVRDAENKLVQFLVDGIPLGYELEFSNLPTGAGVGSLYIGALPNIAFGNTGGIATFAGQLDNLLISSESVTITTRCLHGLTCATDQNTQTVTLAWNSPAPTLDATGIKVECDGLEIATLPLTASGLVDLPAVPSGNGNSAFKYTVHTYGGTEGDVYPVRKCIAEFGAPRDTNDLVNVRR